MRRIISRFGVFLLACTFCMNLWAFKLNGKIPTTAVITSKNKTVTSKQENTKKVYLMKIELTPQQKRLILESKPQSFLKNDIHTSISDIPSSVFLGMNNVPVLDQGDHGSCVTFANTAALDALIGKGDYISQLCHLQLGRYLEQKGFLESGWDGSMGNKVLNQIEAYGIINKENQKTNSCGGLKEYPTHTEEIGNPMTLDEFQQSREHPTETWYWVPMLTVYQRLNIDMGVPYDGEELLNRVKHYLARAAHETMPSRLTFATFIPFHYGSAGACGRYHETNDTWVITKFMNYDLTQDLGGHEMIIIGYDDDAIAVDSDGKKHQGLLILRNSWGEEVGDKGNFYMSYDFFEKYVMELQKIIAIKFD